MCSWSTAIHGIKVHCIPLDFSLKANEAKFYCCYQNFFTDLTHWLMTHDSLTHLTHYYFRLSWPSWHIGFHYKDPWRHDTRSTIHILLVTDQALKQSSLVISVKITLSCFNQINGNPWLKGNVKRNERPMFTQTALRACVFVLKRFFCQTRCFDWLPLLRSVAWRY